MSFDYRSRILADGSDRNLWFAARAAGITATDVAKLATRNSIPAITQQKLFPTQFGGNAWTEHGKAREPVIADWVATHFGIEPSQALFYAAANKRHLATPDGIRECPDGSLELAEIKTTSKPWVRIPRPYMRQIWWQQYVLGADRTLLVWEQHNNFVPVSEHPEFKWIERDDEQIAGLVRLADELIAELVRTATAAVVR